MPFHVANDAIDGFGYSIWYSCHENGWEVDGAQVTHFGLPLLPRRPLRGVYPTEMEAIARGLRWCELVVKHLTTAELPPPALPAREPITQDQLDSLDFADPQATDGKVA